jgi:hypothetical protein
MLYLHWGLCQRACEAKDLAPNCLKNGCKNRCDVYLFYTKSGKFSQNKQQIQEFPTPILDIKSKKRNIVGIVVERSSLGSMNFIFIFWVTNFGHFVKNVLAKTFV